MARDKIGGTDAAGAEVMHPGEVKLEAPYLAVDVEVLRKDSDGNVNVIGRDGYDHNVVCSAGLLNMANIAFGGHRSITCGPYFYWHSAAIGSGTVWNDISANAQSIMKQMSASYPIMGLSTVVWAGLSTSTTLSMALTSSSTVSISGCGVMWYGSSNFATNTASGGSTTSVTVYNMGTFTGGGKSLSYNDTIQATLTLQFTTA